MSTDASHVRLRANWKKWSTVHGFRPNARLALVGGLLALLAATPVTVASATSSVPAAPATSEAASAAARSDRPFSDSSPWNSPIPARPELDARSEVMVARLARESGAYALLYEFGTPVYEASADDRKVHVTCTMPWGRCDLEKRTLRIPAAASPNAGSDGAMVVVDPASRSVCDFWQARRVAGEWVTSWGTCASLDGAGHGPSGGATGAGVNLLAGVVRAHEIREGRIDHALSFATDNACAGAMRHPATKTDGLSHRWDCIPQGARVQLDPRIDVDAIPGITPGEKAVARALQKYGAYARDNAAAPMAFAFEKPTHGKDDPYPAAGFEWDYYNMPHIPWDRLRVLRSWNGS